MEPSTGHATVLVTVIPVQYPGDVQPGERLLLNIDVPGGVSASELREGLIELTGLTDCYVVEEKRTAYEWGASNETFELTVQVAQWGFGAIASGAVWDYLKHLTREAKKRRDAPTAPSREDAESDARYAVALSHDVNSDELVSVGWECNRTDDGLGWTTVVTLEAPTKDRYTVRRTSNGEYGMAWIKP